MSNDTHIHSPGIVIVQPQLGQPQPPADPRLQKVDQFGSPMEKDAVNATQKFSRPGISVKDSRAS